MVIGGIEIPATIDNHGRYLYSKAILDYNGENEAIESRFASILWTFDYLEMSDYLWIHDTFLLGLASRKFTSATIKNNLGIEINPTNIVVMRPTYEFAAGGLANSVTWEMTRIR